MIGDEPVLTQLERALRRAPADGASIFAHRRRRQVMRFAEGAAHEHTSQDTTAAVITAIVGRRVGVATVSAVTLEGLARGLRAAAEIAGHSPPRARRPVLPAGHAIRTRADHDPRTARATASDTAQDVTRLMRICRGVNAQLAGSLLLGADELAVANTAGVACAALSTVASAKLVTRYRRCSGYASTVDRRRDRLDLEGALERALRQTLQPRKPVALRPGRYEVILEPEAVAELLAWMGYTSFGAKSLHEGISLLTGRAGRRMCDPRITIYDDGNEAGTLRLPFDPEGTPKQRVVFIDRGRAGDVVYDTRYGQAAGRASTGHATLADDDAGPLPMHLGLAPGDGSRDAMIRSCRRGLLIPRFHYVNGLLNPRNALMTGLTREGVLLIEDGDVTTPVSSLRFTQSIVEALNRLRGISAKRTLVADPAQGSGCALVPTLHLARFTFTGGADG